MRTLRLAMVAACLSGIFHSTANAAVYEVVEMPLQDISLNQFATEINSSGDAVVQVSDIFNPPIDLSLIDFEADVLVDNLTDIDAAMNGNFNAEDLAFIISYINSLSSETSQKISDFQSYSVSGNNVELIAGFDFIDSSTGEYARNTNTFVRGMNDAGVIVGTSDGPTRKIEYTNESGDDITYLVRDFGNRGFVQINGDTLPFVPTVSVTGGLSEAFDVNNSLLVAGYETTEVLEARETSVENCEDDEVRGDIPVDLCLSRLVSSGVTGVMQRRATLWQIDQTGAITDTRNLGVLLTPADDDERVYVSRALAVNEQGIAVGDSSDYYQEDEDIVGTFAAIFNEDEVIGFTDHEEYFSSAATDINEANIVVGQMTKSISGFSRTKFYYYDMASNSLTFPEDFFPGSSSRARAINNNNIIVGEGEVDTGLSVDRRTNAFMYDIDEGTFQNLNELIACDSPYTLAQAHGINDNNQIVGTATVRRTSKNIKGEDLLDDNGNAIEQDLVVSVLLNPISGGQIDECDTPPEDVQQRSGGSLAWLLPIFAIAAMIRRRKSL